MKNGSILLYTSVCTFCYLSFCLFFPEILYITCNTVLMNLLWDLKLKKKRKKISNAFFLRCILSATKRRMKRSHVDRPFVPKKPPSLTSVPPNYRCWSEPARLAGEESPDYRPDEEARGWGGQIARSALPARPGPPKISCVVTQAIERRGSRLEMGEWRAVGVAGGEDNRGTRYSTWS